MITAEEFESALRKLGLHDISSQRMSLLLNYLDADASRGVDYDEFMERFSFASTAEVCVVLVFQGAMDN